MFEYKDCYYNPRIVSHIESIIPVASKFRFTVHWVDGTTSSFVYEGAHAQQQAEEARKHLIFEVNKSNGL